MAPQRTSKSSRRTELSGQETPPRPQNAYLLFRHDKETRTKATRECHQCSDALCTKHLSNTTGRMWNTLSDEEKAPWYDLAEKKKQEHADLYPGYIYRPRRRVKRDTTGTQPQDPQAHRETTAPDLASTSSSPLGIPISKDTDPRCHTVPIEHLMASSGLPEFLSLEYRPAQSIETNRIVERFRSVADPRNDNAFFLLPDVENQPTDSNLMTPDVFVDAFRLESTSSSSRQSVDPALPSSSRNSVDNEELFSPVSCSSTLLDLEAADGALSKKCETADPELWNLYLADTFNTPSSPIPQQSALLSPKEGLAEVIAGDWRNSISDALDFFRSYDDFALSGCDGVMAPVAASGVNSTENNLQDLEYDFHDWIGWPSPSSQSQAKLAYA